MKPFIRIFLTILPFAYMGLIWYMSSNPDDLIMDLPSSATDRFIKEALHLVEFAILYAFFAAALAANGRLTPAFSLAAAAIACLYGMVDEWHQYYVPSRSCTLIDAVKDIIGVAAVYFHVGFHYFSRNHGFLAALSRYMQKGQENR